MSPSDVLDYWFSDRARRLWFDKNDAFDEEIRQRFGTLTEEAIAGTHGEWASSPDGALALVIALDQFPRNIFRGSPRAFAGDSRARAYADQAVRHGFDRQLPLERRSFLYMPFQHSESLEDQQRSVDLFTRWVSDHPDAARASAENDLTYAHRHFEIVARFARFPHRNAILGRESTPEEVAFLAGPNSSF